MSTATMENKHFVQREGGEFQRQQFQIAASQEAFRILSDGLYSDKVRAVIRELSTNAVDSHIVAGNDDAFEVHLPSYEEPWFSVRDYGTGLSHDEVMNLYSTYFGTNKADDTDTTGCLGLGSKSPLAKVRSFTVISRHEGIERHYIVALNEDRIPEVNYLPEQDVPSTDVGMEIQMAVETGDIREYARKAAQVYFHFEEEKRPRVVNGSTYVLPEREILIEGEGWRMYKGSGTPTAVQGNVGYPIVAHQIKDIKPHHESVLSCHLEIDFPIGSLAFTPSREHLSYNKMTCQALSARLDEIVAEVNATVAKRFDNCKTLWEARVLAWTMFWATEADLRHLKRLADTGDITWKGQKIAGQQLTFSNIPGVEGWSFELKKRSRGWSSSDYTTTVPRRDRSDYTPRDGIVWCEVDIPRGSYARCQQLVRSNEDTLVYLVSFATTQARKEFCERMGLAGNEFIKTSTLPKPAHQARSGGKFHRSTSLVYRHKGLRDAARLYQYWEETEVDLDEGDGGVYVEMKNNKVVDVHGRRVDPSVVTQLRSLIESATGCDKITVIGVRPQVAKRFRKSDDWVDIWTYARNVVKIEVVQKQLPQHIVNAEHLQRLEYRELWLSLYKQSGKLGVLSDDNPLKTLLKDLQYMSRSRDKCPLFNKWRELATQCNISLDAESERDLQQSIDAVYPFLPLFKGLVDAKTADYYGRKNFNAEEIDQLRHYVQLVEASGKSA